MEGSSWKVLRLLGSPGSVEICTLAAAGGQGWLVKNALYQAAALQGGAV